MKLLLLPLSLLLGYSPPKAPVITLMGYHACQGRLLESGQAAFSCYAPTQRGCQRGKVILASEKRVSTASEKTRFSIVDTVQLTLRAPNSLAIARCTTATGQPSTYFVLCTHDALGSKYLRHVQRIWGVNKQGQLVEVPARTLQCLNDDFGA